MSEQSKSVSYDNDGSEAYWESRYWSVVGHSLSTSVMDLISRVRYEKFAECADEHLQIKREKLDRLFEIKERTGDPIPNDESLTHHRWYGKRMHEFYRKWIHESVAHPSLPITNTED